MKKVLSAMLVMMIVISTLSLMAFAADEGKAPEGFDPNAVQETPKDFELKTDKEGFKPTKLTDEMFKIIFGALEEQEGIHIYLNNELVIFPDTQPQIIEDRTLVPIRFIAEQLGANVNYESIDGKDTATIKTDKINMVLVVGDKNVKVNGEDNALDVPAMIIDGRIMVPFRFIFEKFDMNIDYQERVNENGQNVYMIVATSK